MGWESDAEIETDRAQSGKTGKRGNNSGNGRFFVRSNKKLLVREGFIYYPRTFGGIFHERRTPGGGIVNETVP